MVNVSGKVLFNFFLSTKNLDFLGIINSQISEIGGILLKFDRVILSIILAVFFTVLNFSSLNAADFSSQDDADKNYNNQYSFGIYVLTDSQKNNLQLKRYQEVALKYSKTGAVVYCMVNNGPAQKAGLKLYDRIIGIDDHQDFYFLFKNNNSVKVKYIRDDNLHEAIIKPQKNSELNFQTEIVCTKEFADWECRKHFSFNNKNLKKRKDEWIEIYECMLKKGSKIIPIRKNDIHAWLMSDSLDFSFGYYIWDEQNEEKLKYFLGKSKEAIKELEEYIAEDNPEDLDKKTASKKISDLVTNIANLNTYITDERFKKKFAIDNDEFGINRIKQTIIKINNYQDINNLNYLKTNYLVLKKANQNDFIDTHWKKAVEKIDWKLKQNFEFVEIYLNYTENFKPENYLLGMNLLEDLEKKVKKFEKDKESILALRKIYSELWALKTTYLFKFSAFAEIKRLKELGTKLEINYSNFNELNLKDKNYILKKDSLFLDRGYSNISNISQLNKDFHKAIKYADLRLEEIAKDKKRSEDEKLYILAEKFQYLASLGYLNDALNSFYDFKNSVSKVIKTRSGVINLSIASPTMIIYLYQLGLYEEAQELVNFGKSFLNFDLKNSPWFDKMQIHNLRLYEALLLKKNYDYDKAIKILEKSYKSCIINSPDLFASSTCSSFAQLLELYYKTGNVKKFESIYLEKMGTSIEKEESEKIFKYANTFIPDQITGLFKEILDYYKKTNNLTNYNQLVSKSLELTENILSKEKFFKDNQQLLSYLDVYEGLAQLGSYLVENNHSNGILILKKLNPKILDAYQNASFDSPVSSNTKAKNIISSYLNAASAKENTEFNKDTYKLYQVLRNSVISKDIKKSIVRKLYANSKKYELIKKYQDYEKLLSSYYRKDDFILKDNNNQSNQNNIFKRVGKDEKIQSEFIADELKKLSKEINKNFPEYNSLTKLEPVDVYKIQNKLTKEDAVLDYYFDHENVFVFAITKEKFSIFKNKFPIKEQEKLQSLIRNSLTVSSSGTLSTFNIEASHQIYQSTFQFFEKFIQNKKNIFVIPDGLLQNIPLNILVDQNGKNCSNCSNVRWLMAKYNFSYLPSIDFIHFKSKDEKNNNQYAKQYMGIGDPVLGVNNNKDDGSRVEIAKFLNRGSSSFVANTKEIKKIYGKVEGSGDEIKTVASYFNNNQVSILLNENASETKVKSENLNIYKIIHFATHGEISGAIKGYNEPFLVLTPPDKGTDQDDGLLTMTEIMQLENNAEIVILSACNTATGDKKNSDGFSGLARAFLFSGSKSVMVSNWYVETFSAKELIINFMSGLTKNKETSPVSLKNTMMNFIKAHPDKSHPFYWAPFVVVGAI